MFRAKVNMAGDMSLSLLTLARSAAHTESAICDLLGLETSLQPVVPNCVLLVKLSAERGCERPEVWLNDDIQGEAGKNSERSWREDG